MTRFHHWSETNPAAASIRARARSRRRAPLWHLCGGAALALGASCALIALVVVL